MNERSGICGISDVAAISTVSTVSTISTGSTIATTPAMRRGGHTLPARQSKSRTRQPKATPMGAVAGLNEIKPGEQVVICALQLTGDMRRRLLDIGLVENTRVECLGRSPGGDPSAYLIRGAVIAIRAADSRLIRVKPCRGGDGRWD